MIIVDSCVYPLPSSPQWCHLARLAGYHLRGVWYSQDTGCFHLPTLLPAVSYTATPAVQPPPLLPLATSSQFSIAINLSSEECCINGITEGIIFSVQFRCSVVSNSLWPHESQHASPPCPSPTPGVHPNPCPWSQWCHPTISYSVVPMTIQWKWEIDLRD